MFIDGELSTIKIQKTGAALAGFAAAFLRF
jgi:hypothetical protein